MKNNILLIVYVFAFCLPTFGKEFQAISDTIKQDMRPDSTIVCLLDGEQIPYKVLVQKAVADEITWVTGAANPRDAIRYFGITGKNGLIVFVTKETEEVKNEE